MRKPVCAIYEKQSLRCLDSIMPILAIYPKFHDWLASVAELSRPVRV